MHKRTAQGVNVLGRVVAANASCWLVVAPVRGVGGGGRALEAGVCRPAPGPSSGVPAVMEGEGGPGLQHSTNLTTNSNYSSMM